MKSFDPSLQRPIMGNRRREKTLRIKGIRRGCLAVSRVGVRGQGRLPAGGGTQVEP
jgi:hypothetical protein